MKDFERTLQELAAIKDVAYVERVGGSGPPARSL
jgi:hypothetical protein